MPQARRTKLNQPHLVFHKTDGFSSWTGDPKLNTLWEENPNNAAFLEAAGYDTWLWTQGNQPDVWEVTAYSTADARYPSPKFLVTLWEGNVGTYIYVYEPAALMVLRIKLAQLTLSEELGLYVEELRSLAKRVDQETRYKY